MGHGAESEFAGTERFEVRRKLGAGGMGEVYQAFDLERSCVVAIKTLPRSTAADIYRFKREFRALADIEHPGLISLGELIESEGQWFFTMDYIDGVDFLRYVRGGLLPSGDERSPDMSADAWATTRRDGRNSRASSSDDRDQQSPTSAAQLAKPAVAYNEERLRHATSQLALAIAALHQAGKIHRDIKPSNILVDARGKLTVLDFGLVSDATGDMNASTQAHAVGTAAYMSPEQAVSGAVGPATDWYSFGVVLYEALTGTLPYTGRTAVELLLKKQQYEPPPPRARSPDAPRDLDALCSDLLIRNPEERPSAREVLDRLGVDTVATAQFVTTQSASELTEAAIFLGRDSEIEALRKAFARTERATAEVVLIEGESGLGKSTLVSEFVEEVRARMPDAVVLSGRCHERESVPYKALDGVIDSLSRFLRSLPDVDTAALVPRNAALLRRVFPVLGRVEEISLAPRMQTELADAHELRNRAFAALRELLYRCSERRPVLIWIDDFQWTDGDSLIALRELVRSDDAPRALLILSSRILTQAHTAEGISAPGLPDFVAAIGPRRLRLGPLPSESAIELARILLERSGQYSPDIAAHIAQEATGHPLYIAELARHAAQSPHGASARPRLADAITARVKQLPAATRWILDLVAVAGTPLPREIVQTAARLDISPFRKHVSVLRVAHLVRTHGNRNEDHIEPYHDHVRQAVLASQDEARRRECHARFAAALQTGSTSASATEIVLVHLEGAGQRADAALFAERAAQRADAALSFDLAARLYATAIRLGEQAPGERRALRVCVGNATANAGRRAEAARIFLEAVEGASAADALDLQRQAAECLLVSGHLDEGVEVLRRVLAEVGISAPRSPSSALRSVIFQRMWVRIRGLRYEEREESKIAPHELRRVDACWTASMGFGMTDNIQGTAFQVRHLVAALQVGEPTRVAMALAMEALYTSLRARSGTRRVHELTGRALGLADRHGSSIARGWCNISKGMSHYQLGEFTKALECWQAAQKPFAASPSFHFEKSNLQLYYAWLFFYLGKWAHLAREVPAQLRLARERGDLYCATNFTSGLPSAAWLIRDQSGRVERLAREHAARWSHRGFHLQHFWETYALAQVSLYETDPESAWKNVEGRWSALRRSLLLRISMVGIEAHNLRARCALALAAHVSRDDPRRQELVGHANKCTKRVRRSGLDVAAALDFLVRAGVAALRDRRAESVAMLRESLSAFELAEMAAHAEIARWRLAELVGGDEGAALMHQAKEWMKDQGVVAPERMVEVIAPGFERSA